VPGDEDSSRPAGAPFHDVAHGRGAGARSWHQPARQPRHPPAAGAVRWRIMSAQRNLTAMLREAADRDRCIRFISGDKDESLVSTADLWRRARALLGVLQQRGMGPRDELVIFTKSNESFTVAFW